MPTDLFAINPDLDCLTLRKRFADKGRVQIRNFLTEETARELRSVLRNQTDWGLATQAGDAIPASYRAQEMRAPDGREAAARSIKAANAASARGSYGFTFAHYPIVTAVKERWDPDSPQEILLEHLNAEPFLQLIRSITDCEELVRADGQLTLYGPNHYLGHHTDSHRAEGWRFAYVLNLTEGEWHRDWGGYLVFYDDNGDIIEGWRPRFNSLNLFSVPQNHSVTFVAPFAPIGRYSITGWLRDR